jgi:hypothetical protein
VLSRQSLEEFALTCGHADPSVQRKILGVAAGGSDRKGEAECPAEAQ